LINSSQTWVWLKLLGISVVAATLAACGGGSAGDEPPSSLRAERSYPDEPLNCSLDEMRNWVQANMYDYYLFYDQVPNVNLNNYQNVESLIDDLRVGPYDKFSYISDAAASTALFEEGKIYGYGWKLKRAASSSNDVQIAFVYPRSPLADEQVKRGDFLLAINGVHPLEMSAAQWDEFLGVGTEIKTPTFTLLDANGNQRELSVTREEFSIDTVLDARVIPTGTAQVGYLAFTKFLETSNQELEEAFALFNQQGVDELVLDLRYNGGGRISVANKLASTIAGPQYAGQTFAEVSFNEKYAAENTPFRMVSTLNSLSLDRVVVLSSPNTCSASEMIINGLKPFVDVVQIGGTSCGKPYGSAPNQACGKQMSALQFRFVNAAGVGDYYEGIPADCTATDSLNANLGDPEESMLKAGLAYISAGICATGIADSNASLARSPGPDGGTTHTSNDPLEEEKTILD